MQKWGELDVESINTLADSQPSRIQAVVDSAGIHRRY
jgi:hypothetical protein